MEPPDRLEKGIRFGCGFVLGLLLAASTAIHLAVRHGHYAVALMMVAGVACGLLALKYGDRFWDRVGEWLRWW